ncbi:MAG: hypothetical protein OEV94_08575 [Deltaproteobacteria bacterium]|nr:hypothetical protein [Deltaproteobacteria bacterium]
MSQKTPTPKDAVVDIHLPEALPVKLVTGAFGGFGMHDMFRVNFHYDDMTVKVRVEDGKEILEPVSVRREVQARLVMNPQTAVSVTMWMLKSLAERGVIQPDQLVASLKGQAEVN